MNWLKDEKILRIIELIILVGGLIWFAAFLRADIDYNTQWNKRQDAAHEEFMRKDVAHQQYLNIINQLNRIENQLKNEEE